MSKSSLEKNTLDAGADINSGVQAQLDQATSVLKNGGIVAYPTEYCFGLGCNPKNIDALKRLLAIKNRKAEQGVILIAADTDQVNQYAMLSGLTREPEIRASWPGPNTWILPAHDDVSFWVKGLHSGIAMRIPEHNFCLALCNQFGHPIVSTSANRHGQASLLSAQQVEQELGDDLDFIVSLNVGGATKASTIRDAMTGKVLR